jgi:type I restriction enzyme R subunit
VQGFYKKADLELLIQRRAARRSLADVSINSAIVERHYQTRGIRRIAESFERDHDRKALLVMATGAGKTRTVIALCDVLMRCNWAKRVLFLADRVALVRQAVNAFKRHLPDASPVNLVTEKDAEGRVFVSTYPTMMGLIDDTRDGQRRFGVGHFDLVIIDEAHRSVFQKYRAIFDYFDSLLVGLTATPKDEVDRNTYSLFDLEDGVPTDAYSLEEAVRDGFLVPPKAVSVPLKFQREGIKYDELSEEDKDQWDALEWDEEGNVPARVEAEAVNKWLFNKDTVDKVLEHLMTHGLTVAGGDRMGKTIIFAKNQQHANFIAERFNANYPHFRGEFARVITFETEYAQSLIDNFSNKEKAPPHRNLGGHARHRDRHPGGREPGFLQARALEDQVLADARARHATMPGPVRTGQAQRIFLCLRLLPKPRILQPEHSSHRGRSVRIPQQTAVYRATGIDRRPRQAPSGG